MAVVVQGVEDDADDADGLLSQDDISIEVVLVEDYLNGSRNGYKRTEVYSMILGNSPTLTAANSSSEEAPCTTD